VPLVRGQTTPVRRQPARLVTLADIRLNRHPDARFVQRERSVQAGKDPVGSAKLGPLLLSKGRDHARVVQPGRSVWRRGRQAVRNVKQALSSPPKVKQSACLAPKENIQTRWAHWLVLRALLRIGLSLVPLDVILRARDITCHQRP
jgi:hypothetical protein